MLYDPRYKYFKAKLMTKWFGLYVIEKYHVNGIVQIRTGDEEGIPFLVNGYCWDGVLQGQFWGKSQSFDVKR